MQCLRFEGGDYAVVVHAGDATIGSVFAELADAIIMSTISPRSRGGRSALQGAGGLLGFADPTNKVAFGYKMSRMLLTDASRSTAQVNAVYEAL